MGLTPPLIPALLCLLVCASSLVPVHTCGLPLKEIIRKLNFLTGTKNACIELTVADAFSAPKNTTENGTLCRATTVLWQAYSQHRCFQRHLSGLYRSISNMTNMTHCPMNENRTSTLKEFLESLKDIMKKKYSKC
ncbi:interleukin-4 [Echinops telfairi]|uniref:Interleukin-4 n=1 Tax=Echinops telfairi TaxID=9371 RepID=A0ABM0IBY3_ECHTE|nr:interleukin-4 [Echinops telfairi]